MREVRRFTPEEDAYLRQNHAGTSCAGLARHLGRREVSVVSRLNALGLRSPVGSKRRFSPREDASIRRSFGRISGYEIARLLGRSVSSVYGRAKHLGVDFDPVKRPANRRLKGGYWWIPLDRGGRRVWVQEHRLVMERIVGRPLEGSEQVHHINLDPGDNRPENLFLCRDGSQHRRIHNQLGSVLTQRGLVKRLLELGVVTFDTSQGVYRVCETGKSRLVSRALEGRA